MEKLLECIDKEILESLLEYAKSQNIEDIDKELVLEFVAKYEQHKKVNEKEGDKKAYQEFFDKTLKKYKVESPEELSEEDKKKRLLEEEVKKVKRKAADLGLTEEEIALLKNNI